MQGYKAAVVRIASCSTLLLTCLFAACSNDTQQPESTTESAFATDVIGIEERQLKPEYWSDRTRDSKQSILSPEQIEAFNRESVAATDTLVDLATYPKELSAEALLDAVRDISNIPETDRYYADGIEVTEQNFDAYEHSLNLVAIQKKNAVRFGLVVLRSDMRTYPTDDRIFKTAEYSDLDRFQENALFPADAVAILHRSADGQWLLVQSYNYLAWVPATNVAVGERDAVLEYKSRDEFLVVTGDKVLTTYNPHVDAVSELQLDMGVRLPLQQQGTTRTELHGQNPYASYTVEIPVRDSDGRLRLEAALIARSKDVSVGYLPYTRANLLGQSFKFLGERYGWGHSYNARDCTGFVAEIYKSFGIVLPRNTGDQSSSLIGDNIWFETDQPPSSKADALDSLDVGNLIYIPGHVMMYLGTVDGEPYVIHDVAGLNYHSESGEYYSGVLSGVSVTPLLPLSVSEDKTYVESIRSIKAIH